MLIGHKKSPSLRRKLLELSRESVLKYFVLEVFFLAITIWFYRENLYILNIKAFPEIAQYKLYFESSGVPASYPAIWGFIAMAFKLNVFQSQLLDAIVELNLVLLSNYFLITQIQDALFQNINSKPLSLLINGILAVFFALNPFFLFADYKFVITFIAFMNTFFALQLYALKRMNKAKYLAIQFLSVFFLSLAVNEYPLVWVFYFSVYLLFIIPIGHLANNGKKALLSLFMSILFLVFFSNFISLFELVLSPSPPPSPPIEHPLNLVFIDLLDKIPQLSLALTGVDAWIPKGKILNEYVLLVATAMVSSIVYSLFLSTKKSKATILLLFWLIAVGLNLPIHNDFNLPVLLTIKLLEEHVVSSIRFGLIFTAMDANRLSLYIYWYGFIVVLSIAAIYLTRIFKNNRRKISFIGKILLLMIFVSPLIGMIMIAPVSDYPPHFVVPSTVQPYGITAFNEVYNYISSVNNVNYNQWIYLSNPYGYFPTVLFPNGMGTANPNYPFYVNFQEVLQTPYFEQFFQTIPAGTYIFPTRQTPVFIQPRSINSNLSYAQNFNRSNVKVGYPIFVIGSETTFDNFLLSNSYIVSNSSSIIYYAQKNSALQYFPIYNHNQLDSNDFKQSVLEVIIKGEIRFPSNLTGGYLFGISNSTQPWFGSSNNFFGFGFNQYTSSISYNLNNEWFGLVSQEINQSIIKFMGRIYIINERLNQSILFGCLNDACGMLTTNFTFNHFKYVAFQAYRADPSNVNFNVTIQNLNINNPSFIPIFYDSYFADSKHFVNALNYSQFILFGSHYSFTDLLDTYLYWSKNVDVITPAVYAFNEPDNGWFQVFNSNDPQAAYYSEEIPDDALSLQFGYGSYVGYAESVHPNQVITIPLKLPNNNEKYYIALNILYSPLGGNLNVMFGNVSQTFSTYSSIPYYRWVNLTIQGENNVLKIMNKSGVQSINLILIVTQEQAQKAKQAIQQLLKEKQVITTDSSLNDVLKNVTIEGQYNADVQTNIVRLTFESLDKKPIVLEFPTTVNFAYEIKSGDALSSIVPVWGNFLGVLIVPDRSSATVSINLPTTDYYSGITNYIPLSLSLALLIGSTKSKKLKLVITNTQIKKANVYGRFGDRPHIV